MSVSARVCVHNMMCACYFVDKQDNGEMYKETKILDNPEKLKSSEIPTLTTHAHQKDISQQIKIVCKSLHELRQTMANWPQRFDK